MGCRSGGYLIFFVIALGTFAAELLVWWLVHDGLALLSWREQSASDDPITRLESRLERRIPFDNSNRSSLVVAAKSGLRKILRRWRRLTLRAFLEVFVLRPCEICNFFWLIYIVMAQTFGFYQNCDCIGSAWDSRGVRDCSQCYCPLC